MKILGLLRHAKSDWGESGTRDFDRGLNDRGRAGAAVIGDHIRADGIQWDRLIASPAARVRATLNKALPELSPIFDERLYLAGTETIMEVAQNHSGPLAGADLEEAETILIAGHNPGLQEMVLELVSPSHENDLFREASVKFPTATFAVLECKIDSWNAIQNHCAKLTHFARPRDLDPELGPEF